MSDLPLLFRLGLRFRIVRRLHDRWLSWNSPKRKRGRRRPEPDWVDITDMVRSLRHNFQPYALLDDDGTPYYVGYRCECGEQGYRVP